MNLDTPEIKRIKKKLTNLKIKEDKLNIELNNEYKKITIECTDNKYGNGCGKISQIGELEYIQTYYFDNEPYNERWKESEGYFICPYCGHKNRLYGREEYEKLKYYFKLIIKDK